MLLSELKNNPNNPRTLNEKDFNKLLNKMLVYPRLLKKNKLTYDSDNDNIVLGGNQRLSTLNYIVKEFTNKDISKAIKKAQKSLGIDNKDLLNESIDIFSDVIDTKAIPNEWTQDAKGLTQEEKEAFIIIDNVSDGKWDFDVLANEWDIDLGEWNVSSFDTGFNNSDDTDYSDKNNEYDENDNDNGVINRQLKDVFVVPPFSVLDTRQGYWQEQKKAWKDLIKNDGDSRDNVMGNSDPQYKIDKELKTGFDTIGQNVSIFDPVLAEAIIKWFALDNCCVFDCFSGGAFGFVSDYLGNKFTGIELRQDQVDINNKRLKTSNSKYICDDGQNVLKHIEIKSQDLLFSCPPYYDLEVYSDLENDASNQGSYEDFLQILKNAFTDSIKCLKDNRFAVIVVGDVRDKKGFYYDFVGDVKRIFIDNGVLLYNELILIEQIGTKDMTVSNSMKNRKVGKCHQNVLVFFNGDPKEIKNIYPNLKDNHIDN